VAVTKILQLPKRYIQKKGEGRRGLGEEKRRVIPPRDILSSLFAGLPYGYPTGVAFSKLLN
jgi:hypothetical protein